MIRGKRAVLKLSFFVIAVLSIMVLVLYATGVFGNASISTDKEDYSPGETVLISGTGFAPDTQLTQIQITRPDSYIDICPNERCTASLPVTDSSGAFSNYAYVLNGIDGLYTVDVSDGTNNAQTSFTDNGNPEYECIELYGFDFAIEKFQCGSNSPNPSSEDYNISVDWNNCVSVNWTSNPDVDGVISKEGNNRYNHSGGSLGTIEKTGQNDISHITFCGNEDNGNGECEDDSDCDDYDDCTIDSCEQGSCENNLDDNEGPVTSDLTAEKVSEQCKLTIEALETDECSNIEEAEYFLGGSGCGAEGTGTPMDAEDGSFDEIIEEVIKNNVIVSDGSLNIHVRGKDSEGNWGNCQTIRIDIDCIPPGYPTCEQGDEENGIALNDECNAEELLVCGDDPELTANICDDQSRIQMAEYFIDEENPLNWHGINMTPSDSSWDELCEDVEAVIDLDDLEEGTHYLQLHGKDGQENWGKFTFNPIISFIKDTTAPESEKEVGDVKIRCDYYGDEQEAEECWYIRKDTPITITCQDPDPQQTGEFAGGETLHYRQRIKQDFDDDWGDWGDTIIDLDGEATIYKTEDSIHELEYWCEDACDNEEEHHFEIDIVDSKPPITIKTVGEPKVECEEEEDCDYYITQETPITLDCEDQQPHPVNEVTLFWRDYLEGDEVPDWKEEDGYVVIYKEEDSRHILEWYCKDALGNFENLSREIDVVDSQPPEITKEIIGPSYGDCPPENQDDDNHNDNNHEENCYIDGVTIINVTAIDPEPHPVDDVECYYWYYLYEDWDDYYEEEGERFPSNGVYRTFPIQFEEESIHELNLVCKDALENEERDVELFIVDKTSPSTIKTYEGPVYPEEYEECVEDCYYDYWYDNYDYQQLEDCVYRCNQYKPVWIDGVTEVRLEAQDLEPHPSGVQATYWRNTLVDDRYCWNNEEQEEFDCQNAQGQGEWNLYEGPFTKKEESCHLIEYYSVDNVNKTEQVKKQCVFVDKTPPVTTKTYSGPQYIGNRIIQGVNFLLRFITSQTQIILEAEDPQPHPSGVDGTFWNVLVPDRGCEENAWWYLEYWWSQYQGQEDGWQESVCLPEAYVEGELLEPLDDEFWNCVMDDEEPRENWQEYCNITWWQQKYGGEWLYENCNREDLRYKHGMWWCDNIEDITINQDCDHKICYFSEDNVEKQEDFRCQIVSVDNQPPEIIIHNPSENEAENIMRCDQSIVVEVWDEKSGVNESTIYAYLYKIENIIPVRIIQLHKAVYSGQYGSIYEGLMDKQLPPGEYYLRIEAKDNLGNLGEEGRTETLTEGLYVEYLDPVSCLINVGESKECKFTFHVCARNVTTIDMCMYKLGENPGLITPDMLNAHISDNGNSAYVGLCGIGNDFNGEDLDLENGEKVNGKDAFNLSLSFNSNITSILGTGNYELNYTINSWDP